MVPIKHYDAAEMARNADGDFSYVTIHDGSTNRAKSGLRILWTWAVCYNTGVGADQYAFIG
jgi:predicted lipoprotein with Yx(FWY)xxD motif